MANPFVWYELLTSDPAGAQAFYPSITGWGSAPFEIPGGPSYHMWMNGERPIGGTLQLPAEAVAAGAPSHWMVYVGVESVDATHAAALEMGATSHVAPQDIPGAGRFAVLADPQGAMFALHQSSGTGQPPGVGDVTWNELATADPDGAWSFYSKLFGWHETGVMDMGEMGMYRMYGWADFPAGGIMAKQPEMPVSCWTIYVNVPDLNAALEKVKELGGQVLYGPMEVPGGDVVAGTMDPQGAMFALHQRKG